MSSGAAGLVPVRVFFCTGELWRGEFWAQKKGKLDISHRYNRIPLLPSGPGGVLQELVVYDLPGHKGKKISSISKFIRQGYC